jgi:transcriptional regulator with XRE-family HTH domain
MTQKTLADRLGMSARWVLDLEAGRVPSLRLQVIAELAHVLRQDVAKLADNTIVVSDRPADRDPNGIEAPPAGFGTLLVERDEAVLSFGEGIYRPVQRRQLVNTGTSPITRFLVRISPDRHPDDPDRSNALYREHPLTWQELNFTASCEGEPMTWTVKQDRDSFKELYLRFESPDGHRFPIYPGQSTRIEYSYTVGEDKWGRWYTRAVRWPTRHLTVQLRFPAALDPVVWGTQTSIAGEALPLPTAIDRQESEDDVTFDWATDDPPLHARYRLEWRFRVQGAGP